MNYSIWLIELYGNQERARQIMLIPRINWQQKRKKSKGNITQYSQEMNGRCASISSSILGVSPWKYISIEEAAEAIRRDLPANLQLWRSRWLAKRRFYHFGPFFIEMREAADRSHNKCQSIKGTLEEGPNSWELQFSFPKNIIFQITFEISLILLCENWHLGTGNWCP